MARDTIKLTVIYTGLGIKPSLDKTIEEALATKGFKMYSTGYMTIDRVRDLLFELKPEEIKPNPFDKVNFDPEVEDG